MKRHTSLLSVMILVFVGSSRLRADEPEPSLDAVRAAVTRAIPPLEKGSAGSADQRTCFTCHSQALPVLALVEGQRHGFTVDDENLQRQIRHTFEHLERGQKAYLAGRGQGGQVITAGYALWALEAAKWKSDEVTSAVTNYLLEHQKQDSHWSHRGNRPPSSGSDFMTTYVALYGLAAYGTDEQLLQIDDRKKTVSEWLLSETPRDTEDSVFRLRALGYIEAPADVVQQATDELIKAQRGDGGWSQKSDMESDAYATGTVLAALLESGQIPKENPAIQRGVEYLLDTQLDDGTWHVVTRAKGFQTYFESGFPHEKDQFISIAASSWATLALLRSLPDSPQCR